MVAKEDGVALATIVWLVLNVPLDNKNDNKALDVFNPYDFGCGTDFGT